MARILFGLLAGLATLLIVASLVTVIETEWWAIRLLDFPRLQFAAALMLLGLAFLFFLRRWPWLTAVFLFSIVIALLGHIVTLWPYRPGGENFLAQCPAERRLSVMIAKVLLGNRNAAPLLAMVEREEPDLFLAMETDAWWTTR